MLLLINRVIIWYTGKKVQIGRYDEFSAEFQKL